MRRINKSGMRILYDDQGFFEPHGGVSRYFTEVMKRLPQGFEYRLPLVSSNNIYLRQPPFNLPPHRQCVDDFIREYCGGRVFRGVSRVYRMCARIMPRRFPSGEWANMRRFHAALETGAFDVLHLTGPHWVRGDWNMVSGKKPIVVTIHDLIPELFNKDCRVAACRRRLLKAASRIIAVSENTKRDVIRLYGTNPDKITVIYHGHLPIETVPQSGYSSDSPYILYVGKRNGYKNFGFLVRAVVPLLKNGLKLFCTGSAFSTEERKFFKELGVSDCIIQKFVSDVEMSLLFKNAVAFVYPSRYEGFGIPILDAFSAGAPVVLSNCSCFPEVAGDAALYFEDGDDVMIRRHVQRLLQGDSLRDELIRKGKERVKLFSWDKCANKTAMAYSTALSS